MNTFGAIINRGFKNQESGYLVRPGYHPDWVASWIRDRNKDLLRCEDAIENTHARLLDATQISDGQYVMLKRRPPKHEADIGTLFSTESMRSNPSTHCLPILEVLNSPDPGNPEIIVMPLVQGFRESSFVTVGETIDFIRPVFEGLKYMHSYHVSHRDIKFSNVRMDGSHLLSFPIHPFRDWTQRDGITEARFSTRTLHPVKYYLIDFGHSKVYDSSIPLNATLDSPRWGAGDPTIPEFVKDENCNPFAVDVYCVGNLMRNEITEGHAYGPGRRGFGFIKTLIDDMTHIDPKRRPTMEEAMRRLDEIIIYSTVKRLEIAFPCHPSR